MKFRDISNDTQTIYQLNEHEQAVFFMLNRGGEITVELLGEGATAHVFAFFTGEGEDKRTLNLVQKHLAPKTTSSALVKAVLRDKAELHYAGTIQIDKKAQGSNASQESRSLLLSPEASAYTKPALEILADDVVCRHAATVSPLNKAMLFYAKSRGLGEKEATELLVNGFFGEAIEQMTMFGITIGSLKTKIASSLTFSNSREW